MLKKIPSNVSDISDDHTSGMKNKIFTGEYYVCMGIYT